MLYYHWRTISVEFCASLRLLLFYICFRSLLINTRLAFISYFVSDPLRKGHRGLEYQYWFVCLYLFLFAFLIICIETFLHFWLFVLILLVFRRLFCNISVKKKPVISVHSNSRGVFRTLSNIYNGAFLQIELTAKTR